MPETLSAAIAEPGRDLSRIAFEAIAVEAYRERKLSDGQLQRLLGFEVEDELDGFLKAREVWLDYTYEDVERDRETHRRLGF